MQARCLRSALLACTALAVMSLSATSVSAQDASQDEASTEGSTTLQPIVVKGKRVQNVGTGIADTPLATTTTAAEIEAKQITSIEDLGRSLEPGVNFNRNTGAVNIRGLEGPRVLTTIDGIPVPYLFDTTRGASGGVDAFDFSALSAVDVMRGSDSSRAGGGALGGALGLRTLEPEDLIREGRDWGGIAKFTYDSSDNSFAPSAAVAKRFENTSVLFQGSYKRGDETRTKGNIGGYDSTRTEANPADYDQHNLLFKVRHYAESGHMFGVTAERFRKELETDDRRAQSLAGNYRPGEYNTFKDADRDRVSLDYAYDGGGFFDSAVASLYWLKQLRSDGYEGVRYTSAPLGDITRQNDYEEQTFGFVGSAEKTFTTGDLTHRVVAGLDLATGRAEQYASGTDNCGPPPYPPALFGCNFLHTNQADEPRVDSKRFGIFLDDEIGFGTSGFYLTPGVRFDWVERTPKMTDAFANNYASPALPAEFSDSAISPKLRLAYRPSDLVEVYGQWAMGFRAPTAGELYSTFGGPGTYLRRGNAGLDSETSHGFEVGARLGDEDFGGRFSAFHNRYRNFIEAVTLGFDPTYPMGVTEFQNLDKVRIMGVELAVHKRFDNGFHVNGALAYAKGENLDTGAYLASVAPLKAVLGVGYATETWGTDLTWIGAKAVSDKSTATFKAPGYGIVDLTAWWSPEKVEGLTVRAGVYNLFDKEYYDAINVRSATVTPATQPYFSEVGRSFKISLTQRF
ncbi:TonB-dependent hemoglobin/transferrin/lactoferrin family receptor [Shinella daejeonensis]|uniref:TonB-dependent hemoglobin/transferrin/lactoferrin family receptor n=1 Tax=Shinella daejeonensis TaxID=659017 RepID=UPI0020C81AFE|nr:TonB-dependent hemoglobin/transferrin/lactoferrin family receptor [Shinella daejeonensis]MCP8894024.1 TonB-dependent hemoglobin/transferrin/lactoferrin family receptor [Shinella daejeonensis]